MRMKVEYAYLIGAAENYYRHGERLSTKIAEWVAQGYEVSETSVYKLDEADEAFYAIMIKVTQP